MVDRSTANPPDIDAAAVIFDLDGVVTRTASLHAAAWKELFDELLRARIAEGHAPFVPFDPEADYLRWVDGRPRHEGVRRFLAARGIEVREGTAGDGPGLTTVHALAARKDALFKRMLRRDGVGLFQSTIALIRSLRRRGTGTAVVTSSGRGGREGRGLRGEDPLCGRAPSRVPGATIRAGGPWPRERRRARARRGRGRAGQDQRRPSARTRAAHSGQIPWVKAASVCSVTYCSIVFHSPGSSPSRIRLHHAQIGRRPCNVRIVAACLLPRDAARCCVAAPPPGKVVAERTPRHLRLR